MSRWLTLVVGVSLAVPMIAENGAERLRKIRGIQFPVDQCYRVRDLFLEREDFKLHFSDGYLLLAEPVEGRSLAALFLAATDTGEGEVILMPPTPSERQSMARFLGVPVLSESMRTAMMFFTDDTAERLRRATAENPFNHADPEAGKKLAPDWQPVARNLIAAYESRMLLDTLSPDLPAKDGFFAAAISGSKLGRFDILLDPRRTEQISVGQVVWQEGQRFYDLWASFPARSFRSPSARPARKRVVDESSCEYYRIEASLSPELDMRVTARFSYVAGSRRERVIAFELSPQLKVTQVTWGGRPVEYLQNEPLDSSGVTRRGNHWLLVVLEEAAEPGSRHELEFQYQGNVITDAGKGVYYVGARGNWYPSRGFHFTDFDLLFHYPKRLQLVATGRAVENSVDGEVRTARWKPDGPIRVAGFNLGNYERTSVKVGDYTLDVCANRNVEPALAPPPPPPLLPLPDPAGPPRRAPWRGSSISTLPTPESPPDPTRRLDDVTRDSADALQFFATRFGPLPLRQLTISPIPGRFGQGFPGLIYISTLSYYQAADKPLEKLAAPTRLFFAEQLRAHEIAHQWWGNLVTAAEYRDEWLMESLADYSALLYLEQHKGPKVLEEALSRYKSNLLAKTESGDTVESAGAIVLGDRLRTSKTPKAHYTIMYEKGAWVLHMLRRLMGDAKFFSLLSELRRRYEYKGVSTEQFRELAAQFVPRTSQDPNLESFFSQWVYSTGIPALSMQYKVSGKVPKVRVSGVVKQSGVPEDFSVSAPIEIQVPGRSERIQTRVQTANGEAAFSVNLAQRPTKVLLDPRESVLAVRQ